MPGLTVPAQGPCKDPWNGLTAQSCYNISWPLQQLVANVTGDSKTEMLDRNGDAVAAAISGICLVHCLLLPVGLGLAPAVSAQLGGFWHGPEWLHWALILVAAPISVHALWRGHGVHGDAWPWRLAALGFVSLAAGALAHPFGHWEQVLTTTGAALLVLAHWRNWRAGRPPYRPSI